MKKLVVILLMFGGAASAGWQTVADGSAGMTYADTDSIVSNGNMATMSSVLDYKTFQRMVEVGYFSQRTRTEYDCAERRFRALHVSLHADPMGEGKEIYADDSPRQWEAVTAGSVAEQLWTIACK